MSNEQTKAAIIASAAEQFRALFEDNFDHIAGTAADAFVDDEGKYKPTAKVAVSIEFDPVGMASTVAVKIGWSVRYKDESEAVVDPLQVKLPIGGVQ